MATVEQDTQSVDGSEASARRPGREPSFAAVARSALAPLASLKLTVVLFALSVFIVLAGTLAQVHDDIWKVINEYFRIDFTRVWIDSFPWFNIGQFFVWVDFALFFPESFFPPDPNLPAVLEFLRPVWPGTFEFPSWFGIWFPKGWTIGAVMMLNLFAAHAVRFKMQARGQRLVLGWATIAFGCLVTALVVTSGSNADGLQYETWLSYDVLWRAMQLGLLALFGLSTVYAFNTAQQQRTARWLLGGAAVLLALIQLGTFVVGPFNDSAMRILYQLIKGLLAGGVLLVGCVMVFRKRAGIVLLHAGIALMMVFDVLVGTAHVESRMLIEEGQTVRYSEDMRTAELAVVDPSDDEEDIHTVVPAGLLRPDEVISDERLPFDVRVLMYFSNSNLLRLEEIKEEDPNFENPATQGVGQRLGAVPVRQSAGTDTEARVDVPAAYVDLLDRSTGESLGAYLVGAQLNSQTVDVAGKAYELALRFKRLYKPYTVTLVDVQKNDYKGTSNPRDYRSILKIHDESRDSTFEYPVWMNNPLRYCGETFYQSDFYAAGVAGSGTKEATGLQVVNNTGWMIPYVSCMIVMVGMLAQFVLTLSRFLNRRLTAFDELRAVQSPDDAAEVPLPSAHDPKRGRSKAGHSQVASRVTRPSPAPRKSRNAWVVPVVAAGMTAMLIVVLTTPRATGKGEMDVHAFGELPVMYQGRPQPLDAVARNALVAISDKQTYKHDDIDKQERSKPAIQWLLDVIAKPEEAAGHRVFRIESVELVDLLGLERRPGSWRYGMDEFEDKWAEMRPQLEAAIEASQAKKPLTLIQRKQLELQRKVSLFDKLRTGFRDMGELMPPLPTPEDLEASREKATQQLLELRSFLTLVREQIPAFGFPLAVPTHVKRSDQSFAEMQETDWASYPLASIYAAMDEQTGREVPPAFAHWREMINDYAADDVAGFNTAVAEYRRLLESVTPEQLALLESGTVVSLEKTDFEAYFNRAAAFNWASWIYVLAFVLVACSWLGWTRPLNRAAFWVIAVTFVLHTLALVGRIYISGRPPVTNLYSSAVFIGWAGVLFGLGLEAVYRLGIGNVVAAASGFLTLRIAHGLAMDGDTFHVLEAVLDTQFWLATHVVCVTLGYAATYVAALLGAVYLLGTNWAERLLGVVLLAAASAYLFSDATTSGDFTLITLGATATLLGAIMLATSIMRLNPGPGFESTVTRMNYGVLCFALFFSFVGTVLGGLWADDSWGRFWGWDPKENGALIIVLWNALVLHARWDGMIKSRGLAVLTVLGGIVVSWSWFGVNELGVGLHSYGFTEGRLPKLGVACATMLFIAGLGCLPRGWWRSARRTV